MDNEVLGLNRVFPIYNADGTPFNNLVLKKAVYDSVVMSLGDKITGDVYYKDNTLAVTMSEYIEFKANPYDGNEDAVRFILVNPPTVIREGVVSNNSELHGMTKYSFEFYHPMYQLSNFPFTDIAVSLDEQKYLSQNKTFSWIGNLFDMIAKLNKNLQGTQWVAGANISHYEQDGTTVTAMWQKAEKIPEEPLSFDKNYISDALKTSYDTWEIPFVIDQIPSTDARYAQGKRFLILFGVPSNEILNENNNPYVFQFGQGVGLKNNSRTPKNNKIVTRIIGYGSERNIPFGYPQIPWTGNQSWNYTINNDPNAIGSYPIYDGIYGGQSVRLIKHPFTRKTLMPSIYADTVNKKVNPYATGYNPNIEIVDYYDADNSYVNPAVVGAESVEIHQFEDIYPRLDNAQIVGISAYSEELEDYITEAQFRQIINSEIPNYPPYTQQRMSEMLNAFGLGVDAKAGFNGGSYTYEWVLDFDEDFCKVHYGSPTFICDYTVLLSGHTPNVEWDDSLKDDGTYKQSYFKITLPQLSFDIYACASITEEMKINMRSGDCIGCTFNVQVDWDDYKSNFYDSDGKFDPVIGEGHPRDGGKYPDSSQGQITVIVQKDIETFGTIMPNIYQQPQANDEFVVLGISLPTSYITNAQQKLDDAAKQYMLENNVYYHDYPLKFDEHFLATNTSILAQMRNNTIVRFKYGDEPTMALYIKQMTTKYGNSPLPQYDITLTDDVEIVLNQIGQVTDDVSRMRVQMSELQKYYSGDMAALNEKLSRVVDDVCQGRITFQQGLDSLGNIVLHGDIRSPQFETGLYTGKGWRIDNLGNGELESLRVRSYLEVVELLINRLQAQEGDTLFTDNDQIEKVDRVVAGDGSISYILSLKEKWDGYITPQMTGNILRGIINTLAAKGAGVSDESSRSVEIDGANKYYTSWMRVIETHNTTGSTLQTNQIRVELYSDDYDYIDEDTGEVVTMHFTPAGRNFEPCELMTVARWGCYLSPDDIGISSAEKESRERRQRLFMISVTDGRVVKYTKVNKPILDEWNYGVSIGELPQFVKEYPDVRSVLNQVGEHTDWLYAQGVVVGKFIKVDINGKPEVTIVDCGEWIDGSTIPAEERVARHGVYMNEGWNETSQQFETHDVWHNNARWRCLINQPIVQGGIEVFKEPTDENAIYWRKIQESTKGKDGNGIVSITRKYAVSSSGTSASDAQAPADIQDIQAWSDGSPAVTTEKPYLWTKEITVFTDTTKNTTKYYCIGKRGDNGIDAKDVEFVYVRTTEYVAPTIVSESGEGYKSDDYKPLAKVSSGRIYGKTQGNANVSVRCTDDQKGVDGTWKYEWEIKRTKGNADSTGKREWNNYPANAEMTLHNSYAESSLVIDINNDNDQFGVDSENRVLLQQVRTTIVSMYYGTQKQAFTSVPTFSLKYDDGTSVLSDVAEVSVSPLTSNQKDYTISVTIKKTPDSATTMPFASHNGLYVDISGTCAIDTKKIRFTVQKVMGGESGISPTIYQLSPSMKSISFNRDASNNLTPASHTIKVNVLKTIGNQTTEETTAISGITYRYGWDVETTAIESGKAVGSTFTVSNTNAANHYQVWLRLSAGDVETLPITKDGVKGDNGKDAISVDLDNEHDDFIYDDNGNNITGTVTSQARLYYGINQVTDMSSVVWRINDNVNSSWSSSLDTSEVTASISSSGLLTITGIKSNAVKITVRALYPSNTSNYYYASFTANKVKSDKYDLILKPNSVSYNSANYQTQRITPSATRIDLQGNKSSVTFNTSEAAGNVCLFYGLVGANGTVGEMQMLTNGYFDIAGPIASTNSGIYFELRKYTSSSAYRVCDYDTVPITKASNGTNGTSPKYITVKGACTAESAFRNCGITVFNGTTAQTLLGENITADEYTGMRRGLALVTIKKDDLSIGIRQFYDTYGNDSGVYTKDHRCNALASAINNVTNGYFICLMSQDAIGWNDNLINALKACGSNGVDNTDRWRYPFAFIGCKGLPEGYAFQMQLGSESTYDAEVTAYVINGVLSTSRDGKSVTYDAEHSSIGYAISSYGSPNSQSQDYPTDITSWSTTVPSPQKGKYLWTRDITAYNNDGTLEYTTTYGVSYWGTDGSSVQIDTNRTFVRYSTQKTSSKPSDSTFTLDNPPALSQGDYLWILTQVAYVGVPDALKSYSVSRVGTDGNKGDPGTDGYTTHFAYATSADGSQNFSTTSFSGATYIGTYRDRNSADSTNYRDYTWTRWMGMDGQDGKDGATIKTSVERNNFTEAQWNTYGTLGHPETWTGTSSSRNGCKTGDLFLVVGTATDTGNAHTATYKCTNDSGDLAGECIAHVVAYAGADGKDGKDGKDGQNGAAGERGKMGRNYYYAGEWSNNTTYVADDTQAPYVLASNGSYYMLTNAANDGANVSSYNQNPTSSSYNNGRPWSVMTNDFKYIITEALFTDFAKLGSGVFNEDWLLSAYGKREKILKSSSSSINQGTNFNYIQVPNMTSIDVIEGNIYSFYITWYSASGYSLFARVAISTDGGSNYDTTEEFCSANTSTSHVDVLSFRARFTGKATLFYCGSGTITKVVTYDDSTISGTNTGYRKFTPSFPNTDYVHINASNAGQDIGSTTYSYVSLSKFTVVQGMTYKLQMDGIIQSGSGTCYVSVYKYFDNTPINLYGAENTEGVYYSTTTDGGYYRMYFNSNSTRITKAASFTPNFSGEIVVKGRISSSGVVGNLQNMILIPVNPFVPKVAIDWLSGYAHFGGDNIRFNPDGSGHLAGGNITWDEDGNADFNGNITATGGNIAGNLDVTGGLNVKNSSEAIKVKINGGSVSKTSSDEITIVDADGFYVKRGSEGFRLTTNGFQRWNSLANSWVPFYASRYVRTVEFTTSNISENLNLSDDFVVVHCTNSTNTLLYLPNISANQYATYNGKVISIVNVGTTNFQVLRSGSNIIQGRGIYTQVQLNEKDRFEMVFYGGTWFANYMSFIDPTE